MVPFEEKNRVKPRDFIFDYFCNCLNVEFVQAMVGESYLLAEFGLGLPGHRLDSG